MCAEVEYADLPRSVARLCMNSRYVKVTTETLGHASNKSQAIHKPTTDHFVVVYEGRETHEAFLGGGLAMRAGSCFRFG